ncbi:sensor histidine kinase [Roseomonas genomospecies 6]|uniref:histidine kinase n=1 Tax=Roseomonas genomospecies 6 TaxID=214106 RepID=A0A9W7NHV3_9PROT|nr:PAS domain-containing sensor histidine kinase [Roseomonas genomospecies 6]KAA0679170.1 hypothetical protein DS843_16775 [Roseomonas genomospecies 6]
MSKTLANKELAPFLEAIMEHVPTGLTIAKAPDVSIVGVSSYGAALLERPREKLEGIAVEKHPEAYQVYRASGELATAAELPLTRAVQKGEVVRHEEWLVGNEAGEKIPILCNAGPIRDEQGAVIGGVIAWADLRTQKELERKLQAALEEKERLYLESNHRTKNHLQLVAGMVMLEAARHGPECKAFAENVMKRVQVIASVHESFYRSDGTGVVDMGDYLRNVCEPLASGEHPVLVDVEPGLVLTMDQATPVGMIANEAVCNSLKHGYPDGRSGTVRVTVRRTDQGMLSLSVVDDGVGLPSDMAKKGSLGVRLMSQLARQVFGSYSLENGPTGGTVFNLTFAAHSALAPA